MIPTNQPTKIEPKAQKKWLMWSLIGFTGILLVTAVILFWQLKKPVIPGIKETDVGVNDKRACLQFGFKDDFSGKALNTDKWGKIIQRIGSNIECETDTDCPANWTCRTTPPGGCPKDPRGKETDCAHAPRCYPPSEGKASIIQKDGVIKITIPSGNTQSVAGAVKTKSQVTGDFRAIADIKLDKVDGPTAGASLLLTDDAFTNQVGIMMRKGDKGYYLTAFSKLNKEQSVVNTKLVDGAGPITVQMRREGDIAKFFYKDKAGKLTSIGSKSGVYEGEGKIYLRVNSGASFPAITASFDNFNLSCTTVEPSPSPEPPVDKACELNFNIGKLKCEEITMTPSSEAVVSKEKRSLEAKVTGGSGTYKHKWSVISDGSGKGGFSSTTTNPTDWTAPANLKEVQSWTIKDTVKDTSETVQTAECEVNLKYSGLVACFETCDEDSDCESNLRCMTVGGEKRCVNPNCTEETDCACASPGPSPSPSPKASVKPSPSPEEQAELPEVTTPSAEQPTLPEAGVNTPVILGVSAGILLMILGLLF